MNTNYFARIMVFGLVCILLIGCRDPEKFLDEKQGELSLFVNNFKNYKEKHTELSSLNYPDEEMYEVESLIEILREVKRLPNVKDHLEANSNHDLYINFRNGLKFEGNDTLVNTYFYFSMGDTTNLNDPFALVKVFDSVIVFNELMRCPTMCPLHKFNSDYQIPRPTEKPEEPKNPDN